MRSYQEQIEIFSYDIADEKYLQKKNPEYEKVLHTPEIAEKISKIYSMPYSVVIDDLDKGIKKHTRIIKAREEFRK